MNIACSLDDNYLQHTGIMLISLFTNNSGNRLSIYILYSQLKSENKSVLIDLVKKYKSTIKFIKIPNRLRVNSYKVTHHVSVSTYFRIFIPELIPGLDKVLYLDSDLIVEDDLLQLYNNQVDEFALAAIPEAAINKTELQNRLMINESSKYFNGGVLLLNCNYWRKNNITNKLIKFITQNEDKIVMWDQDAMNALLSSKCLLLPPKYNLQTSSFAYPDKRLQYSKREINEAKFNPVIIHFSSSSKPWQFANNHPLKKRYWHYLGLSPWNKYTYQDITLMNLIKRTVPLKIQYYIGENFISKKT